MQKKTKVLIAEDDRFISRAYQDGLGRAGFEVISVFNGREALEILEKEKPAVILLDLIMPVMNGFEFLTEFKKDSKKNKIPVIVLSNLGQESDIKRAKDLGATDFLIKSDWALKDVITKIKGHLK